MNQITNQSSLKIDDMAHVAGKGIYMTFQWDMVTIENTADPELNGSRQKRLKVLRQVIGDPGTKSAKYMTPERAKEMFPAEWEYFTKHGDMPVTGTALSELPGISVSQMQLMQINGLRSVEDVLAVDISTINRMGLDARMVRGVAEKWSNNRLDNQELIDFAAEKAKIESALEAERKRSARMEADLAATKAQIDAMQKMLGNQQPGMGQMADQNMSGFDGAQMVVSESVDDFANPLAEGSGEVDDNPLQ